MPTSLVEKIAKVAKGTPNLLKEGEKPGEYFYLRAVDVFDAIRTRLFEEGVLIIPVRQTYTRSQPYLSVREDGFEDITDEVFVEVNYEITDGTDTIDAVAHGVGQDHAGKALYIASTGAKKDLLKTLFLLAGHEDDSESVENTERITPGLAEKIAEMEKKFGSDAREWPIGRVEVNAWMSAARKTGYSVKAQKAFFKKFGIAKISDLKRKDFDLAMKWALGQQELALNGEDTSSADDDAAD